MGLLHPRNLGCRCLTRDRRRTRPSGRLGRAGARSCGSPGLRGACAVAGPARGVRGRGACAGRARSRGSRGVRIAGPARVARGARARGVHRGCAGARSRGPRGAPTRGTLVARTLAAALAPARCPEGSRGRRASSRMIGGIWSGIRHDRGHEVWDFDLQITRSAAPDLDRTTPPQRGACGTRHASSTRPVEATPCRPAATALTVGTGSRHGPPCASIGFISPIAEIPCRQTRRRVRSGGTAPASMRLSTYRAETARRPHGLSRLDRVEITDPASPDRRNPPHGKAKTHAPATERARCGVAPGHRGLRDRGEAGEPAFEDRAVRSTGLQLAQDTDRAERDTVDQQV